MAAVGVLTASLVVAPTAAAADDPVVGSATVKAVQVTGDPSERFNLVILGDGYTAAEQGKFEAQVTEHLNVLWSIEPYKSYRNYFNVYAIEIISGESGISCDSSLTSPRRTTPLSMSFWGGCNPGSVQRLITMNGTAARTYAALAPKSDQVLALANSDTYGGAGGSYATASGGNAMSALISPHELGHSLGGLADEYDYYSRGVTTGNYTGAEPRSAHHTLLTEQQMADEHLKWFRWLGEASESGGTIGRYEGGMYYSTGVWRPSRHSIMKTLGYYYDQVGREVMTEKISAKTPLVPRSTPTDAPVAADQVLWVQTAHPVSHQLDVSWAVNGTAVSGTANARELDLAAIGAKSGDTVTATVVDNTEFVRDPALRAKPSMTQVRTWTVGAGAADTAAVAPTITESTTTERAIGEGDVVYLETNHPADHDFTVAWSIDGTAVATPAGTRNLELAKQNLSAGTHTVSVTVSDPAAAGAPVTRSWTVDDSGPQVTPTLSTPESTSTAANGEPHYVYSEQFSMKLTATDDQPGYVVAEFRLDGDGWHNYYGWPTDKNAPFLFTPTGTNVDDLIYGNLGSGGMSLSPFQQRTPGYGTHRIEYRAIDAAGNYGPVKAFTVTVHKGDDQGAAQIITAKVDGGGLTMTSSGSVVTLPGVKLTGVDQVTSGTLNPVRVADARGTATEWSLTGQVSDFSAEAGVILGRNLGWSPSASIAAGNSLPVPGGTEPAVVSGAERAPGSGISEASTLCAAAAGTNAGGFDCGAGLALGVPGASRLGTYNAVLTLTLI
jgi:hypothetical protein